jgi:hypothetical protein
MRKATFFYLLRRGLLTGAGGFIRDGLVMASKFITQGLTHPAQGSAEFNGSSDYIQIKEDGKGSAFDTQEFTIGAWVNAKTLGDNVIWSYDHTTHSAPYYAQQFRLLGQGAIYFAWNNNGTLQELNANTSSYYSANNWHYVVATMKAGAQRIYFDGSVIASSSVSPTITYYNQEVWIGKSNFGGEFDGNMANVAFWNRALSSDEINSVMWKGYQSLTDNEKSGLKAWYSLDDITSPAASLANMEQLATDKNLSIENKAAVTAAINALS